MIKISLFSKLSNISIRSLRHYDKIGLLKPDYIEESTKYRYYSAKQLERSNQISQLKSLGFSLQNIKKIIDNENNLSLDTFLNMRKIELENEIEKITKEYELLETIILDSASINKTRGTKYNIVKKNIPARKVICLKETITSYKDETLLWEKLYQYINKHNIIIAKEAWIMSVYHDEEYKDDDVCVEVQVSVEQDYPNKDNIIFYNIPELEVISTTFNGSYEQMPQVVESIALYSEINNYNIIAPMINIFHVSPIQDNNSENWITEACYIVNEND